MWSPHAPKVTSMATVYLSKLSSFFPLPQLEIHVVYVKVQLWLWKHMVHLRRYLRVSYYLVVCVAGIQVNLNWEIVVLTPPDLPALIIWVGMFQTWSVSLHALPSSRRLLQKLLMYFLK